MPPDVLLLTVFAAVALAAAVYASVQHATTPRAPTPAQSPGEAPDPQERRSMDPSAAMRGPPEELESDEGLPTVLWSAEDWQAFKEGRL